VVVIYLVFITYFIVHTLVICGISASSMIGSIVGGSFCYVWVVHKYSSSVFIL